MYCTTQLVAICDFAVAVNIIRENPIKNLKLLPQIKNAAIQEKKEVKHRPYLDFLKLNSEIKKVYKCFYRNENLRCRLLLELSFHLLLRPGEMVTLKVADYDATKRTIVARDTKTLKEFIIPLNSISKRLVELAIKNCSTNEYIFSSPNYSDKHLSRQVLNAAL